MYSLPTSNYLRRNLLLNIPKRRAVKKPVTNEERVREELRLLGASRAALSTMEAKHLHRLIHADEHIGGVIFGFHKDGFVMLAATDKRVIFLDKKPLFINEDEIDYRVVSGVSYSQAGFGSLVTLHTRIKDYAVRTFNEKCARGFVSYIEQRGIEHPKFD